MDLDLDQLAQAVLHLPVAARAELASRLLESLDAAESSEPPETVAAAWEAELDRRESYFASDVGVGISAADAFQRLEARVVALRTPRETPR